MSLRRTPPSPRSGMPMGAVSAVHVVMPTTRPTRPTQPTQPTGDVPPLPDEIWALILLSDMEVRHALTYATQVLESQMFSQLGEEAIRRLCSALARMMSYMRIRNLPAEHSEALDATIREISMRLRMFLNRVNGWNATGVAVADVSRMCVELETLLEAARVRPAPPGMSRFRASDRPGLEIDLDDL